MGAMAAGGVGGFSATSSTSAEPRWRRRSRSLPAGKELEKGRRFASLSFLLASACASPLGGIPRAPTAGPASATSAKPHVFVIVMENQSFSRAISGTFTATLANRYAVATNYHAIGYPSVPNHLALTSGQTSGARDALRKLPEAGIDSQVESAGLTWRGYFEGYAGDCFNSTYPYPLKHNPLAYYGGDCPVNIVPIERLQDDLGSGTANLTWIVPGLCNSTHDCSVGTGDAWLAKLVPQVLASAAWRQGGVLFIVWDEDGKQGDNRVPAIVVAPKLAAHRTEVPYDHYSLLASVEDLLRVPRLGMAARALPMADLLPRLLKPLGLGT